MGGCAVARTSPGAIHVTVPSRASGVPEIVNEKNLELYSLFWLDATVKSPELIESHDELRSIINSVDAFERNNDCENALRRVTHGKVFVLVRLSQGLPLLSRIHHLSQIDSIYLYHSDEQIKITREDLDFNKVRSKERLFTDTNCIDLLPSLSLSGPWHLRLVRHGKTISGR